MTLEIDDWGLWVPEKRSIAKGVLTASILFFVLVNTDFTAACFGSKAGSLDLQNFPSCKFEK